MKKTILAVVASCFMLTSYAQDSKVSIGVKGGLNIASISNTGGGNVSLGSSSVSSKYKSRFLFHLGGYTEIRATDFLSVQPELLFSMKGYGYESSSKSGSTSYEYDQSLTLSYLDIPLLLRFNFGKGFNAHVGPYFGFLLSAKSKSEDVSTVGSSTTTVKTESSDKDGLNTIEGGINLGAGYQLENGLNFSLRWARGFTNVYDYSGTGVSVNHSNNVFQFSVGFNIL